MVTANILLSLGLLGDILDTILVLAHVGDLQRIAAIAFMTGLTSPIMAMIHAHFILLLGCRANSEYFRQCYLRQFYCLGLQSGAY